MKRAVWSWGVLAATLGLAAIAGADAPTGKKAFQENGCTACHEIGKDKKGPDLKGVTSRRSKEWILSFIVSPEKHYDEPEIKALIAKYKVKMPNQEVDPKDASHIVDYLTSL